MVEQCLDGGRVGGGVEVIEAAARVGVHRATVHRWVARYLAEQIGGWGIGSRRVRLEMLRRPGPWRDAQLVMPSEQTIDRILIRQAVLVSDTTLAIELADQDTKIVRRTTS